MEPINPKEIRYIKLGPAGKWVRPSLDNGEIHFGYADIPHEPCLTGDWDAVQRMFEAQGKSVAKAKDGTREIRDFYELGLDTLWVTFADGHLCWAFAEPEVEYLGSGDGSCGIRRRKVSGGWHKQDIHGHALDVQSLSTRLTQTAAYRQTICKVKEQDYLLRRINDVEEPILARTRAAEAEMLAVTEEMIKLLHWADFEVLVDLIFARSGWQRVSALGGPQADVDLVLEQPITGERAYVQVKSRTAANVLGDYAQRNLHRGKNESFYFVFHSASDEIQPSEFPEAKVWGNAEVARRAINLGLPGWIKQRL